MDMEGFYNHAWGHMIIDDILIKPVTVPTFFEWALQSIGQGNMSLY